MTAPIPYSRLLSLGLILPATLITFLVIGCSSDRPDYRAGGPSGRRHSPPPLAGKEVFFNGQITAELTVGHGPGFDHKPDKEDESPSPEHRHPGEGGFHRGGGGSAGYGGRPHGDDNESGSEPGDMSAQIERQQMASMRRAAASTNPPVMIHLRFTNHGTTQAELLIADFLSPLGNFVVEPEKLVLAPGQTLEVEPMTSRLVGEISGVTVTLALRLGGRGEKKSITLTIVPGATPEMPMENTVPAGK